MKNHSIFALLFLFPFFPFWASAQQYLWPSQAWQERDLVNPAAPHESFTTSNYHFLMGASLRHKSFGNDPAAGPLADWWTATFRIEHFAPSGANGNWLLGGRLYTDRFGATELSHGSLRLGWRQTLNKEANKSSLTAAFRIGAESFRLKTSELYFLQPGDPLQNGILSSLLPVGGAGIFYEQSGKGLPWSFHIGLSQPALLRPDLSAIEGGSYDWEADFKQWHGLLGGFVRLGNGRWLECSTWGKTQNGQEREGSVSLRYHSNWGKAKTGQGAHGGNVWVGIGGSTFGYLHLEAGCLFERLKIGVAYDWWVSPVAPVRSIPLQVSIAWLGSHPNK